MTAKMTLYKHKELQDDDSLSCGSVQLTGSAHTSNSIHIRYQTVSWKSRLWSLRTLLERALLVLTAFFFLVVIVLVSLLSTQKNELIQIQAQALVNGNYCMTDTCIHSASYIIKSLDRSVDPCENFYEYACNSWIRDNPIPPGKSIWGAFAKLETDNQVTIRNVLTKPLTYFKSKAEQKAKTYYESCMDTDDTIEKLGARPMIDLIVKVGGWNLTSSKFNVTRFSLQNTLQIVQNRYNMGGLFNWLVSVDDRNSSRHVIQIDQGGLTLPTREHYLNVTQHAKVLQAYEEYMIRIATLLGAKVSDTNGTTRAQVREIIKFETRIAEITTPVDQKRDEEKQYKQTSLADLDRNAPFISWTIFFADALRIVKNKKINQTLKINTNHVHQPIQYENKSLINSKEKVVLFGSDFLGKLTPIIREYNASDAGKTVLNNYLIWQIVKSLTSYLSKDFRDAYKPLRKALLGLEVGEETWRYCVSDTSNVMGFAIGAMFVRANNAYRPKIMAEEMISEIREAFKSNLDKLSWMDDETRRAAMRKADAISDMIGYPEYILNPQQLDDKYSSLEIRRDEYFMNNIKVNQYAFQKNIELLRQPVNRTNWEMTPNTVNAYYTPTKNKIVFPTGILQKPFFDAKSPYALNYGAMGVIMGHELIHAFDDQGRQFDGNGNLHQWWNNATTDRFKKKTDCFKKQYDNYRFNKTNLNGLQTLGENIADNGGLKASYRAYVRWETRQIRSGRIPQTLYPLPGLDLTHRQLFFVAFAQVWCSAITNETMSLLIEKDSHSLPMMRVLGTLSNSVEFAEEFQCKVNSKMNPAKKCEIW